MGSFEEFQQGLRKTGIKTEHNEPTLNNAQIQLQVERADRILAGFVPPMKEGG